MERDQCEKQMAAMKEAFMLFDTDGDGRIAPSDMGVIMRSLGANPTQAQLRNMEVQEDLRSPLGLARFLDLMFKYMKPEDSAEAELRDAFRVIDKESTGYVAVSDLRHILTSIGEKLEPTEFDDWIREVGVGSDGRFWYEEFISYMVGK